jgi:23S rRNA G2069 N7-methylase RlmK/C1962 C5-methylase RlmI
VVDWYAGHLVIGEYTRTQSTPDWLPRMGEAVAEALEVPPENLHLKQRFYGHSEGRRYERVDFTDRMIEVREGDLKFYVNPWDYVDTGLFADHRETRRMVRDLSDGKDVLNLFCYSGSFTCYAANGGAASTVSVDRAKTAIDWTRRNLALNGFPPEGHQLVQSHAFGYLSRATREKRSFDLAVVDPPSFYTIRSREDRFDINRDHPALLTAVLEVMRRGGLIFFSTNHQDFVPRMEELPVAALEEITSQTIPEDYESKRKRIHRCWRITV